ncbi:hypothetical protein GCK32_018117 [Trichostrongylus colubriformis]|uniref:Uncharacterized protein n=1 Tax=Trichostrongylus colubriformis TaxID=6319 RepID=A0AAN8IFE8_TRICO
MERLICIFALIGATLACQPVTKPTEVGRGNMTARIYLISDQSYDPAKLDEYMGYFPDTMIEEYSSLLGDFSGLRSENISGNFSYMFTLTHCDCVKVKRWMDEIVKSSEHFTNNTVICSIESTSSTGITTASNSSDISNTGNNKNTSSAGTTAASNSNTNDNADNNMHTSVNEPFTAPNSNTNDNADNNKDISLTGTTKAFNSSNIDNNDNNKNTSSTGAISASNSTGFFEKISKFIRDHVSAH